MSGRPVQQTVADAEWLFSWGVDPREAAARLNIKVNTLQQAYKRAGVEFPWVYSVELREYERKPRSRHRLAELEQKLQEVT